MLARSCPLGKAQPCVMSATPRSATAIDGLTHGRPQPMNETTKARFMMNRAFALKIETTIPVPGIDYSTELGIALVLLSAVSRLVT